MPVSVRGGSEGEVHGGALGGGPGLGGKPDKGWSEGSRNLQFHRDKGKAVFLDLVTGRVKKSEIWDRGHRADLGELRRVVDVGTGWQRL